MAWTRDTEVIGGTMKDGTEHVVVMGLGRFGGGVGVTQWLAQQGKAVTVTDVQGADKLADSIAQLNGLPVTFSLGSHPESLLDDCDLLVISPAVDKAAAPFFQAAMARKIPYTTEINEFCRRCKAPIVGITGSVGKSTTASMIHAAIVAASPVGRCLLGGNIGRSLLSELDSLTPQDVVILELSSFMLEDTPLIEFSPHIAVVTNLVNNHLDRHGTMEKYAQAKLNILRFQKSDDVAVLNANDPVIKTWGKHSQGKAVLFDYANLPLSVPGQHNQANAAAALAVVDAMGCRDQRMAAVAALCQFKALSHRMELIAFTSTSDGRKIRWFNDSKATTPESTLTALKAMPARKAILIVGGADKHADMTALAQELFERAWGVVTMGATGPAISALMAGRLTATKSGGAPHLAGVQTLNEAVKQAYSWTHAGEPAGPDHVLLSPACASYDQFSNYEHRGRRFVELVTEEFGGVPA